MALVLADRVRESSATTGTGPLTLSGAVIGFQTFSSAIGNGNTCYYTISNPGTAEWEVGVGTVGAGTLARTTILSSSNGGSVVSFTAGNKDVFVTYPAEKSVNEDVAGVVNIASLVATTADINGGTIDNTTIGVTTPSTGAFTTISASGQVTSTVTTGTAPLVIASTTKVSNLNSDLLDGGDWAAPGSIGSATPNAGAFTTVSASGQVTSTVTTGTAPLVIASTTKVNNLNVDLLDGGDWTAPGTIGSATPNTGAFTTITATGDVTLSGTGAIKIQNGTTGQRPGTPAQGMLRYNTSLAQFEGYNGTDWGGIGGAQAGGAIQVNNTTASVSYTIATGTNGFSVGPITTASGVTITVASGQRWVVI